MNWLSKTLFLMSAQQYILLVFPFFTGPSEVPFSSIKPLSFLSYTLMFSTSCWILSLSLSHIHSSVLPSQHVTNYNKLYFPHLFTTWLREKKNLKNKTPTHFFSGLTATGSSQLSKTRTLLLFIILSLPIFKSRFSHFYKVYFRTPTHLLHHCNSLHA